MRYPKLTIIGGLLVLAIASSTDGSVDGNAGTSSFSFLKIGIGARPMAMGGAFVALSEDVTGSFWNPAGLALLRTRQGTSGYLNYVVGVKCGYLAYAQPFDKMSTIGLTLQYLSVGSMAEMDASGKKIRDFSPSDLAVNISYAYILQEDIFLGGNLKYLQESISKYKASGLAIDLGAIYETNFKGVTVGACLQNLGKKTKAFVTEKEKLPTGISVGVGYRPKATKVALAMDIVKPMDNKFNLRLGGEYQINEFIAIRGGYDSRGSDLKTGSDIDDFAGLSCGFGLKWKKYTFDYAFAPYAELGNTHWISLSARF
ncbi:MAG: PorV/PorQ family protein [Candidatus Edwardsbacteria bacterium]